MREVVERPLAAPRTGDHRERGETAVGRPASARPPVSVRHGTSWHRAAAAERRERRPGTGRRTPDQAEQRDDARRADDRPHVRLRQDEEQEQEHDDRAAGDADDRRRHRPGSRRSFGPAARAARSSTSPAGLRRGRRLHGRSRRRPAGPGRRRHRGRGAESESRSECKRSSAKQHWFSSNRLFGGSAIKAGPRTCARARVRHQRGFVASRALNSCGTRPMRRSSIRSQRRSPTVARSSLPATVCASSSRV